MNPITMLQTSSRELKRTKALVQAAMLLALQVFLSLFATVPLGLTVRVSFNFLASVATAMLFGPFVAMLNGGLADILQFAIHPSGPYMIGLTINAMLSGLVYGFAFYQHEIRPIHVIVSRLIVSVFISIGLGTLWLSMAYGTNFWAILPDRVWKNLFQFPVDVILVMPLVDRIKKLH